jgi:hypothetical protein
MTFASEMRCRGPAAQAAKLPALRRCAEGPDGRSVGCPSEVSDPSAWFLNGGSRVMRVKRPTPGTFAEQASNTARGTPWVWRTCGLPRRSSTERRRAQNTRQASMSRGVEARGSIGTPGVPRALGSLFPGGRQVAACWIPGKPGIQCCNAGGPGACPKIPGGGALAV